MVSGKIYLAKIQFTDQKSSKIRPILLIKKNSFNDYIFMPLTTNLKIHGHKIDNDKIIKGYLPKPSIIVIEKISVIDASMIIKEIATIEKNEFLKIILSFTAYINE